MGLDDLPKAGYKRILILLLYGAVGSICTYLFFRFLWKPILPFLLAAVFAMLLQKPLDVLDKMTHRRKQLRRIWAVVLVVCSVGIFASVLFFIGSKLLSEGKSFFSDIGNHITDIGQAFDAVLWNIRGFLSSLPGGLLTDENSILFTLLESADAMLIDVLQSTAASVTAKLSVWVASFLSALPQVFLFITVLLIAAVYFTMEWQEMGVWLTKRFPNKMSRFLGGLKSSLLSTLLLYGRAYFIIILITFSELYIGFLLLDVPYALGAAGLIALIDILPVLGTGSVLIPWSLWSFFNGSIGFGMGLLALYAVISIVRQITEPRIVGKNIGIHPLLALFSMYAGAKLFGLAGLFFLPIAAAAGSKYYEKRIKEKEAAA